MIMGETRMLNLFQASLVMSLLGLSSHKELDLLQAIAVPFEDPKHVYFAQGMNGLHAFGLRAGSDIRTPYSLIFPNIMFENFAILATIRPADSQGGFLFSVVSPQDSKLSLGLSVTGGSSLGKQTVSLYMSSSDGKTTRPLVDFIISSLPLSWTALALKLEGSMVTLFINCQEVDSLVVNRPRKIKFEQASSLFVGQGGGLHHTPWEGIIQELRISEDPRRAEDYCLESTEVIMIDGEKKSGPPIAVHNIVDIQTPSSSKGERGERGPMGPRGPPGQSVRGQPGPPGVQGLPGPPGKSLELPLNVDLDFFGGGGGGECGCNESIIERSIMRLTDVLPKGDKGELGSQGIPGTSGLRGQPGPLGPVGPTGTKGDRGVRGETGLQGPQGRPGQKGVAGLDGVPGRDGDQGPPGPPGPPGFLNGYDPTWSPRSRMMQDSGLVSRSGGGEVSSQPGLPGPKGERGDSGANGEHGLTGRPGDKGELGYTGSKGDKGSKGELGSTGPPGSKGDFGPAGLPGTPGQAGPQGNQGIKGEVGPPGPHSTILYNNSTGLPMLPPAGKGEPGARGLPGLRGRRGDAGLPGSAGDKGEPGVIPTLNMTALRGDKGDRGRRGKRGRPGPPGLPAPVQPPIQLQDYYDVTEGHLLVGEASPSLDSSVKPNPYTGPIQPGSRVQSDGSKSCSYPLSTSTVERLIRTYSHCPPGTVVFLQSEQTLVFKVDVGWRYIMAGGLVDHPSHHQTN